MCWAPETSISAQSFQITQMAQILDQILKVEIHILTTHRFNTKFRLEKRIGSEKKLTTPPTRRINKRAMVFIENQLPIIGKFCAIRIIPRVFFGRRLAAVLECWWMGGGDWTTKHPRHNHRSGPRGRGGARQPSSMERRSVARAAVRWAAAARRSRPSERQRPVPLARRSHRARGDQDGNRRDKKSRFAPKARNKK